MLDYYSNFKAPCKNKLFANFCNYYVTKDILPHNLNYDIDDYTTEYLLTEDEKVLYLTIKEYVNTKNIGSLTAFHVFYNDYIKEIDELYKNKKK